MVGKTTSSEQCKSRIEQIRTESLGWRSCLVDRRQCQTVSLQDGTRFGSVPSGNDDIVRSALIKTVNGTLKRPPLVKLAPIFEKRFQAENRAGIVGALKIFPKNSRKNRSN